MAKNKEDVELIEEEVGSDPRVYELGFHIDPELPQEEVKKTFEAIRERIAEKGTIVAEGQPENVQLAYTISRQDVSGRRDFNSAYFSWIAYETLPEHHGEVIAAAKGDSRIIRFIDLLTTKDAARHAVEMHELAQKTAERVEDPEAAAGSELDAALESVTI
jgi:ribosomal protein S6